ncbi:MAG: hypothetical protein WC551_12880 [Patescibacteria group bacterium]
MSEYSKAMALLNKIATSEMPQVRRVRKPRVTLRRVKALAQREGIPLREAMKRIRVQLCER